ncbi:C40 family peptidase [Marinococcus halophilus]|uniref:C40 family peptidase n=1 Tax=Marinococcus halophilus TaxID=1371 RepID=UPI0015C42982|nr:C40 family peptidase [Marinococcus halophilus]
MKKSWKWGSIAVAAVMAGGAGYWADRHVLIMNVDGNDKSWYIEGGKSEEELYLRPETAAALYGAQLQQKGSSVRLSVNDASWEGELEQSPAWFDWNGEAYIPVKEAAKELSFEEEDTGSRYTAQLWSPAQERIARVIEKGEEYTGTPYKWGASESTTEYFDCSSFTQRIYAEENIDLPRVSEDQAQEGRNVAEENWKRGDLIFFDTTGDGSINHVSMYISNDTLFHATESDGVGYTDFSDYWRESVVNTKRFIG